MSKLPFSEQEIRDGNVTREQLRGRGRGLLAARDISPRGQMLFVRQPLILALDNARLQDTCYQCFATSSGLYQSLRTSPRDIDLKACTGCGTVKFCDRICQKIAWNRYHKYECKVYGKLRPRVLPTAARAIVRLLLERKNGLVSDSDWRLLFTFETHQDEFIEAGGQRWEDLCLMAKAIHSYSGTSESIDTVLKVCCILIVNSFTLTDSSYEPLGVILHPYPALVNHSCTPNSYVRFDVTPPPPPHGAKLTHADRLSNTSISIHALEHIPKDTEITISYVDSTLPTANRQSELSSQYFFNCTCPLCLQGANAITDAFLPPPTPPTPPLPTTVNLEEAHALALQTLSSCDNSSTTSPPAQQIAELTHALSLLSQTRRFPLHRHPAQQLRNHLIRLLLKTSQYDLALQHALIRTYRIDPVSYASKCHSSRLVNQWMVYRLSRLLLIEKLDMETSLRRMERLESMDVKGEVKMLAALMCENLKVVSDVVLPEDYKDREYVEERKELEVREKESGEGGGSVKHSSAGAKKLAQEQPPPPYIGPEIAPADAVPSYSPAPRDNPIDTAAATTATDTIDAPPSYSPSSEEEDPSNPNSNTYPGSTSGPLDLQILSTLSSFYSDSNSDSNSRDDLGFLWDKYEDGTLAGAAELETWVEERLEGMLRIEREGGKEREGS